MGVKGAVIFSLAGLFLGACASLTSQPAPINLPHTLNVGSQSPARDIDTCINDAFTAMAGPWTMRFAISTPEGRVIHNQADLIIRPKARDRWIIQRPGDNGAMQDYSEITHYGDGQMESIRLTSGAHTIFEERYLECHAADASGRIKFVSTLDERMRRGGPVMRTTRTGWVSKGQLYSVDVSEALDGSGEYALSTRIGNLQE